MDTKRSRQMATGDGFDIAAASLHAGVAPHTLEPRIITTQRARDREVEPALAGLGGKLGDRTG